MTDFAAACLALRSMNELGIELIKHVPDASWEKFWTRHDDRLERLHNLFHHRFDNDAPPAEQKKP